MVSQDVRSWGQSVGHRTLNLAARARMPIVRHTMSTCGLHTICLVNLGNVAGNRYNVLLSYMKMKVHELAEVMPVVERDLSPTF